MRRCTACFRFQPGQPTYCAFCGRSFDVRLCARGHRNPRTALYCAECGSPDLSTPTPPAGFLFRLSGAMLSLFSGLTVLLLVATLVLSVFFALDWSALAGPFLSLVLMIGFLYWTTTLLPGPVKRVGRAAGRTVVRSLKGRRQR